MHTNYSELVSSPLFTFGLNYAASLSMLQATVAAVWHLEHFSNHGAEDEEINEAASVTSTQEGEDSTDVLAEYADMQHGITCIPIIMACREAGIVDWLRTSFGCQLRELALLNVANVGHLAVAVRALVSIGMLQYDNQGNLTYVAESTLASSFDCIPAAVMELYSADMHQWLKAEQCPLQLKKWVDIVVQRWPGVQCAMLCAFLDGTLILPLLMALTQAGWIQDGAVDVSHASSSVRSVLIDLFKSKGWLSEKQSKLRTSLLLTNQGAWISQRVLSAGVAVSYRPLLSKLRQLLLSNPGEMFTRDVNESEEHVDRTLNVIGSGFQHTRYFSAMEKQVISIIQGSAAGEQPRYIVDTGCGDGTLLCMLYEAVTKAEDAGPGMQLTMVGVDYNAESLVATRSTCNRNNVPLIAVQGEHIFLSACLAVYKLTGLYVNCR